MAQSDNRTDQPIGYHVTSYWGSKRSLGYTVDIDTSIYPQVILPMTILFPDFSHLNPLVDKALSFFIMQTIISFLNSLLSEWFVNFYFE